MEIIAEIFYNIYSEKRTFKDVHVPIEFDDLLNNFTKSLNKEQYNIFLNLESFIYEISKNEKIDLILYLFRFISPNIYE